MQTASRSKRVTVEVGFSAGDDGSGIAYARLVGGRSSGLVRVGFHASGAAPGHDRVIAYCALIAVSRALSKRGIRDPRFVLADASFLDEIATGRGVLESLAIPYVRLRCALNALGTFSMQAGSTDDLTQRARAEVALNVAA